MLLAIAVVFPSFEIATPRMITMMLTTSMISNSVKPCCFLFVLISIKWGPSVFLWRLLDQCCETRCFASLGIRPQKLRTWTEKIIRLVPDIFQLDLGRSDCGC